MGTAEPSTACSTYRPLRLQVTLLPEGAHLCARTFTYGSVPADHLETGNCGHKMTYLRVKNIVVLDGYSEPSASKDACAGLTHLLLLAEGLPTESK